MNDIISYIRDRGYMSGIEREKARVKATGEIFTPTPLVQEILNKLDELPLNLFTDSTKTFLDPSCGDGQFLGEILIRKIENGIDFEIALRTIYGIELMQDNVDLCRKRLLCGREDLRHIVEQNIVQADALKYHYRFDGSHPYDDETKKIIEKKNQDNLFVREKNIMTNYIFVKKINNEFIGIDFDDWTYDQISHKCLASDLFLKKENEQHFVLNNIKIEILKNGPHIRIKLTGNFIDPTFNKERPISYYRALKGTSLEQAQIFIVDWFKKFDENQFKNWRKD